MDLPRLDVDRRLVSGWQPQSRAGTAAAADGPADAARGLLVDDEVVLLLSGQLDGLLATLAQAREANAASVREDIAALRLIPGTIRLLPTEGELTALRVALAAVVGGPFEPILEDGEPASSSASGEGGVRAERA